MSAYSSAVIRKIPGLILIPHLAGGCDVLLNG